MYVRVLKPWGCPTHSTLTQGNCLEIKDKFALQGIKEGFLEQISPQEAVRSLAGIEKRGPGRPKKKPVDLRP